MAIQNPLSQLPTLMNKANNQPVINFAYNREQVGLSSGCCYSIKERETTSYCKESLNSQLATLADQMHKYIAVNHFYYDAVEALFNENEIVNNIQTFVPFCPDMIVIDDSGEISTRPDDA